MLRENAVGVLIYIYRMSTYHGCKGFCNCLYHTVALMLSAKTLICFGKCFQRVRVFTVFGPGTLSIKLYFAFIHIFSTELDPISLLHLPCEHDTVLGALLIM